jgi:Uma2 family endonuclease
MSEAEYREFALGDKGGQWELHRGELVEKPPMTARHGGVIDHVLAFLFAQLDRNE